MIAPPVDRGLIAAAKDVATTVEISSTKLTEPANSAATSAAMGNRAGMTTPVVELTQLRMPEVAARMGVAVFPSSSR